MIHPTCSGKLAGHSIFIQHRPIWFPVGDHTLLNTSDGRVTNNTSPNRSARNMNAIKHSINNYDNQADVKCLSHPFGLIKTTKIFVSNQLDAQFFFMYVYFYSLHVSGSHVPIIRRINCINTTSGICHSVQTTVWCARLGESLIQTCKPNGHLYRVTYTRCGIDTILLMMGTCLPETCRE